jgi:hypothetical protein
LAYALVAFAVGGVQSGIIRSAWWVAPVTTLVASFGGVQLYGLLGALIGQSHFVSPRLVVTAAAVAAMNAVLALPTDRAMTWALASARETAFAR